MKSQVAKKNGFSAEFMLKEYERICSLKMAEDQQAEQRVSFFLAIVTAGIGAIGFLFQASNVSYEILIPVAQGVLIVLLLFGIVVLNRLSTRVIQLEAYGDLLAAIQDYFASHDPDIASYVKFQREVFKRPSHRSRLLLRVRSMLRGSLNLLVILGNGLICGGIALIAFSNAGYSLRTAFMPTMLIVMSSIILFSIYYYLVRKALFPYRV